MFVRKNENMNSSLKIWGQQTTFPPPVNTFHIKSYSYAKCFWNLCVFEPVFFVHSFYQSFSVSRWCQSAFSAAEVEDLSCSSPFLNTDFVSSEVWNLLKPGRRWASIESNLSRSLHVCRLSPDCFLNPFHSKLSCIFLKPGIFLKAFMKTVSLWIHPLHFVNQQHLSAHFPCFFS